MKAIILAAGMGKRLMPYTEKIPKALIKINGKPIIFHIIDRVLSCGIDEIVIIVGFQADLMKKLIKENYKEANIKFITNLIHGKTNTLYSLWLAREEAKDEFIYIHGDILFNKNILNKLINSPKKNSVLIDKECLKKESFKEVMKVIIRDGKICNIGKELDTDKSHGKAVGLYRFSKEGSKALFNETKKIMENQQYNVFQSEAIRPMLSYIDMYPVYTSNLLWVEVDEVEDITKAKKKILEIKKEEENE